MDKRYLFRAWLKEYKMMVDVMRLNHDGSIEAQLAEGDDPSEFHPSEYILMQSTGLLATKSYRGDSEEARLVFEGDIVNLGGRITVIVWDDKYARHISAHRVEPPRHFHIPVNGEGEIIGTIHDHPELLGGEKGET